MPDVAIEGCSPAVVLAVRNCVPVPPDPATPRIVTSIGV
jgi:hypothetical protein